jgi:Fe-S-cluster-containing dehydrogenase component/CRP-like cAMP-binding protein
MADEAPPPTPNPRRAGAVEASPAPRPEPAGGTRIPRPKRWAVPFSDNMTEERVDSLLAFEAFAKIDPERFPPRLPLRGVLRNDTKVRSFEKGDIIVREGDYGNSAFLILSGSVRVVLDSLPAKLLGRRTPEKKTLMGSIAQLWRNSRVPEARSLAADTLELSARTRARARIRTGRESNPHVFLADLPRVMPAHQFVLLHEGELFGEIAAIGRTPRTTTVLAEGDTELLEIRWQGLRELRLFAPAWKDHIDRLYRERALFSHLRETPVLAYLEPEALNTLAAQTQFATFGNFDWTSSFHKLASASARERVGQEPLIAREGDYPNGLILIRSGNARLSVAYNHGERTISYLGKGRCFGLEEILSNARNPIPVPLRQSLRAIGYVDILVIPTAVFEAVVLPTLTPERLEALGLVPTPPASPIAASGEAETGALGAGMLEFLVENRFINGAATMLIDMDRCTRCDDCVRACASTHDGNPRFIRQGLVRDNIMVANACMHCVDPVCMIGCPTGAISRDSFQGQIVINDATCIGCAVCANSCPYQNIHMVPIRDRKGEFILDEVTHTPIAKATKCDYCVEQIGGPACVNACPHDAMVRADMSDVDFLSAWTRR